MQIKLQFKSTILILALISMFIAGKCLSAVKMDNIHVVLTSKLGSNDNWSVDFCGKKFHLERQVFTHNFSCEGSIIVMKNNSKLADIYISGDFAYYIIVDDDPSVNKAPIVRFFIK